MAHGPKKHAAATASAMQENMFQVWNGLQIYNEDYAKEATVSERGDYGPTSNGIVQCPQLDPRQINSDKMSKSTVIVLASSWIVASTWNKNMHV